MSRSPPTKRRKSAVPHLLVTNYSYCADEQRFLIPESALDKVKEEFEFDLIDVLEDIDKCEIVELEELEDNESLLNYYYVGLLLGVESTKRVWEKFKDDDNVRKREELAKMESFPDKTELDGSEIPGDVQITRIFSRYEGVST